MADRSSLLEKLRETGGRAVLVLDPTRTPHFPASVVGDRSGHWRGSLTDIPVLQREEFRKAAEGLVEIGWKKTDVPPFYFLYEEPENGNSDN